MNALRRVIYGMYPSRLAGIRFWTDSEGVVQDYC